MKNNLKNKDIDKNVGCRRFLSDPKGITLISLVIIIVILIILAGVAISLSLGENGIFERAKFAKEQYTNEQVKEESQIAKISNEMDNYVAGNRLQDNAKVFKNLLNNQKEYTITNSWTTINETITLNDSIENYDIIVFNYYANNGKKAETGRWRGQDSCFVKTIGYNNSNEHNGNLAIILNKSIVVWGSTTHSFQATVWFKDNKNLHISNTGTSLDSNMSTFVLEAVYGVKL